MKNKTFFEILVTSAVVLVILAVLAALTSNQWIECATSVGIVALIVFAVAGLVFGWTQ